ncbi:PIN domain-containing protein [Patescibacteria group bacterium]|nr:PIN domain-containing protein [Patescibacteria group bacterium]
MVILDTNIIIDHLRQKNQNTHLKKITKKTKQQLAISIISIQELFTGKSTKKPINENYLLTIINSLNILSYTYQISKLAGEINRDLKNPIEFADSAIAATTIINNAKLFTLNSKHFQKISNLPLLPLL